MVETQIMARHVDDPAAKTLEKILVDGINRLSGEERSVWVRFIIAQWMRSPDKVLALRQFGEEELTREFDRNPEEYLAVRGDAPEATLREWAENQEPGLAERVSMMRVLPALINNPEIGDIIFKMSWQVLDLAACGVDLLLSDRPAVQISRLKRADCHIVVPLSPTKLFVAMHNGRKFQLTEPKLLAKATNKISVSAAVQRIWSTGEQHRPLLEKWATAPISAA